MASKGTKLGRHPTMIFWDDDDAILATSSSASDHWEFQRLASDRGVWIVEIVGAAMSADPGASALILLEGRLSQDAPWAELHRMQMRNFWVSGRRNLAFYDIGMAPEMRVRLDGTSGILPNTLTMSVRYLA